MRGEVAGVSAATRYVSWFIAGGVFGAVADVFGLPFPQAVALFTIAYVGHVLADIAGGVVRQ